MSTSRHAPSRSRRHFLRGMGVALTLPWMESLPAFAQAAAGTPKATTPPRRLGIVFFSNGVEPAHWWAKGSGAAMELGPGLRADAAASRRHGVHQGPLQPVGPGLDQPPPRPHEPVVGSARQPRSERDPRRHVDGPGAGRGARRPDGRPEPRARHRAQRAAARRRPLDDLRVEPVVGLAHAGRRQGDLPRAGVRSPGRRRVGPHAGQQHPRCGAAGVAEPEASDQQGRRPQARASTSRGFATSRSGSRGRRRRSGSKAGAPRSPSPTCRARSTSCRRTCRLT